MRTHWSGKRNAGAWLGTTMLAFAAAVNVSAQVSTYIGTSRFGWSDPAAWDTGVVPDSPTAEALIHRSIFLNRTPVTLGTLHYAPTSTSSSYSLELYNSPGTTSGFTTVSLHDEGIVTAPNTAMTISLFWGSRLEFFGHASLPSTTASGAGVSIYSSIDNTGPQHRVAFHDASSAGTAYIDLADRQLLLFDGHSTAARATINAGEIVFRGDATAGNSRILLGKKVVTSFDTLELRDRSTAGAAKIENYGRSITFRDDSSSGTAVIEGQWTLSGHRHFGFIDIRDRARTDLLRLDGAGTVSIDDAEDTVTLASISNAGVFFETTHVYLGARTLRLNGGAFTGLVDGTGTFVVAGNLDLSGASLAGLTRIESGQFVLRRGLRTTVNGLGSTTVEAGAKLLTRMPTVTITGDFVNRGTTTIEPEASASTIRVGSWQVSGRFEQAAGATLNLDLLSAGELDRLTIAGAAKLGGAVILNSFVYLPRVGTTRVPFLTAQAIEGTFDSFTLVGPQVRTAMLETRLDYSTTDVALALVQGSFAAIADTRAASALGAHLDATLPSASGASYDLLANLNSLADADSVRAALTQLSPERYRTLAPHSFLAAAQRQTALERQFAAWRSPDANSAVNSSRFAAFAEGGSQRENFAATPALAAQHWRATHALAGAAWTRKAFQLGAAIGQERSRVNLDALGGSAREKALAPEAFAQWLHGDWFVHARAATSRLDLTLRRPVDAGGVNAIAAATVNGQRDDGALTVGRTIARERWMLTPQLGVLASRWRLDDFAESGAGAASLAFRGWKNESLRARAGFDFAGRFGRNRITPRFTAWWLHELSRAREIPAGLAATGASFRSPGEAGARDLLQVRLSAEVALGRQAVFSAGVARTQGEGEAVSSDFSAGVAWRF